MEKTRFFDKKKIFDLDTPSAVAEFMARRRSRINNLLLFDEDEETEETDYVLYEYIDLVYPPGSTPPIRESIKRMTIFDLSPVHNMICR